MSEKSCLNCKHLNVCEEAARRYRLYGKKMSVEACADWEKEEAGS